MLTTRTARRFLTALFLVSVLPAHSGVAQDQPVQLSLPQARNLGLDAIRNRRPDIAYQVATGLLSADPTDPHAQLLMAAARQQMGQTSQAQSAAVQAFRFSRSPLQKYLSSQKVAELALHSERFLTSQLWLRRSLRYAPDVQARDQIVKDYRRVRDLNPISLNYTFSVTPSSNINNGSSSDYQVIDGLPFVGILSGDAQALSGLVGSVQQDLSYRLHRNKNSESGVRSRLSVSRVHLSDEARTTAPTVDDRDFGSTTAEIGGYWTQAIRTGIPARLHLSAKTGKTWYGGSPSYSYASVQGDYAVQLTEADQMAVNVLSLLQRPARESASDIHTLRLGLRYGHRFSGGGSLHASVSWSDTRSDTVNITSQGKTAALSYSFARPIAGSEVSVTLGRQWNDYDRYRIGPFLIPGGRGDGTLFGALNMVFTKADYAGFVPSITVTSSKSDSNISRFDTSRFGVQFGIQSAF